MGRFFGPWRDRKNDIFERKTRDKKTSKKHVNKVVASAGDADPGKEGFREDNQVGLI